MITGRPGCAVCWRRPRPDPTTSWRWLGHSPGRRTTAGRPTSWPAGWSATRCPTDWSSTPTSAGRWWPTWPGSAGSMTPTSLPSCTATPRSPAPSRRPEPAPLGPTPAPRPRPGGWPSTRTPSPMRPRAGSARGSGSVARTQLLEPYIDSYFRRSRGHLGGPRGLDGQGHVAAQERAAQPLPLAGRPRRLPGPPGSMAGHGRPQQLDPTGRPRTARRRRTGASLPARCVLIGQQARS